MFGIADRLRNAVLQIPRTAEACPPPLPPMLLLLLPLNSHTLGVARVLLVVPITVSLRSLDQSANRVRRYISPGGHHWSPEDKGMSSLRLQRRVLCIYRQSRLDKFCGYSHTMSPFVASHFKGA